MNFITHPHRWLRFQRQAHSYDQFYAIEAPVQKRGHPLAWVSLAVAGISLLLLTGWTP